MTNIEITTININDLTVDSQQNFLIIDDDPSINEILVDYLQIVGFNGKFLTANTLLEAKKHLKFEKVNYILSDWNLPDGEGISLLKAIRKSVKFKDIPFLMITGQCDVDSLITSSKIGSSDFLTKPFNLSQFKEKLVSGWKTHVIPTQDELSSLKLKVLELEADNENLINELATYK
ncbi:response regulator [Bacteriovoracaceae bacterium]|nr:response regulator [Bacteriovoracaceae bacterium]